ncbi:MAG TPA: diacylglycerol kinase family protein [Beijerinckiaceae bacterium]|nr:diacylglycerol kinase family protein [Beijerinckiaceae bacterium]
MRVTALVNAAAGTAERHGPDALRGTLADAFERQGLSVDLQFVPGDQLREAAEAARGAAARGEIDAVAVGGGDGTISTVAAVLAGTGIPLAVLPLGTLNHFAKDLGIPADLDAAVAVISPANMRAVDVASVNGEVFVNNSSIGIYPYMVVDRERRRSLHGQSKWVAMFWALLRGLRYFPLRRLSICAEGWAEPCRTPCVFVGNNEYCLDASSFGTRERLNAGTLCLYVARQQSRPALLWLAFRSAIGLLDRKRDLRTFKSGSVDISSRTSRLLVALDGEVLVMRSPLEYRVRPGALRVFAPGDGKAA